MAVRVGARIRSSVAAKTAATVIVFAFNVLQQETQAEKVLFSTIAALTFAYRPRLAGQREWRPAACGAGLGELGTVIAARTHTYVTILRRRWLTTFRLLVRADVSKARRQPTSTPGENRDGRGPRKRPMERKVVWRRLEHKCTTPELLSQSRDQTWGVC